MNRKNGRLLISALVILMLPSLLDAQDLSGAWKLVNLNGRTFTDDCIKIYSASYFMFGMYASDGTFVKAGGGSYNISGEEYLEVLDFHTDDSSMVRVPITLPFSLKGDELTISSKDRVDFKETWKRVDDATSALSGAWRFGARVNEEGIAGQRRGADSPRQTMKILSTNHFQWAAFNYETKQFSGTGGGTYESKDGAYTETIRFFSRDNSRVGKSLSFECKLVGSDWYHKGKGTTGNPVSEVWEKVK